MHKGSAETTERVEPEERRDTLGCISLKPPNQVKRRSLTVVKPRQDVAAARFSEDYLESVLNLPVADVARGVGHAKAGVA